MIKRGARAFFVAALLLGALFAASSTAFASSSGRTSKATGAAQPKRGGSFTDLFAGGNWQGLDPATDTSAIADTPIMGAIYGALFELGPNGVIIDDEASGVKLSDHNLQVDISIRPGVKFQDGTPFTASAVAFNINRDLDPTNACICLSDFTAVKSVTAVGKYDVRIKLSTPYSPLIPSFVDNAPDWTASPTAIASKGESNFAQDPVGAGPFEVVSNTASSKLVLKRYPGYWEKGHPYLSSLTFLSTTSDQSDLAAVQSGQAQFSVLTTISLVQQGKTTSGLAIHPDPATSLAFVRLNTTTAPLNNKLAREALFYATDTKSLVDNLYAGLYTPIEGFTGPGMLFYEKTVPHYDTYNLTKAKALVKQIGGLTVQLRTNNNTPQFVAESEALAAMWQQAGINASVTVESIQQTIQVQSSGNGWQTVDAAWTCSVDPATCMPINLSSTGSFTGLHSSTIDGLINQGTAFASPTTRQRVYSEINEDLASQSDFLFLYARPVFMLTQSDVEGIQDVPATGGEEQWENVWIK
jgi:peptide/nickel transport system substrate-binding protein